MDFPVIDKFCSPLARNEYWRLPSEVRGDLKKTQEIRAISARVPQ